MAEESSQTLLEVRGLSASLPDGAHLQNVSFEVPAGAVVVVFSEPLEAGALLLDCLCGAARPQKGDIRVGGADVAGLCADERQLISGLRGPAVFPEGVTAGELLEQLALLLNQPGAGKKRLADLGLEEQGNAFLRTLGPENQQLVRLASAGLGEPRVLVAERIDRDLSPVRCRLAGRLVKDVRDRGGAVVFTTDNMETAEAVCTQVLVLKDGQLVAYDTPENLILAQDNWMRVEVFTDNELAVSKFDALEYVHRAVEHGNRYALFVKNEFESVRRLLGFFDKEGVGVKDLRTYRSTLSDVVWELL